MKHVRFISSLALAAISATLSLALMQSAIANAAVNADEDIHYLAFASDYHSAEGSIENAMQGMPMGIEYVSLIGDMVGERGGDAPKYNSSDIMSHVDNAFPGIASSNVSIIWADHDMNVNDDATGGIVKCMDGKDSGVIFEGEGGSYYIYAIAHYDMTKGGEVSLEAAAEFKDWVDTIDEDAPIIVLCHVPIQALRGDNNGAMYWNEALNYAATGVEDIRTTDDTATITRNVLFLHGHNHTSDSNEYYFGAGSVMKVQLDTTVLGSTKSIESNIYYTSFIPGYLKTSGNATLVSITSDQIKLEKFNGGENVSCGINGFTQEELGPCITIERVFHPIEAKAVSVKTSILN
ncbi:MAG: hypothetical protein K5745_05120 [Saccharofermentans sp.]|nr:hypothetical protein [Saccharofermentans sp.]